MKYRFTPFHLSALYFLGDAIYTLYKDSKIDYEVGLGGLEPFLLIGLVLMILLVDLIIQFVVVLTIKLDTIKIIYLIEFGMIVITLIWVWKTFYPTIIRQ